MGQLEGPPMDPQWPLGLDVLVNHHSFFRVDVHVLHGLSWTVSSDGDRRQVKGSIFPANLGEHITTDGQVWSRLYTFYMMEFFIMLWPNKSPLAGPKENESGIILPDLWSLKGPGKQINKDLADFLFPRKWRDKKHMGGHTCSPCLHRTKTWTRFSPPQSRSPTELCSCRQTNDWTSDWTEWRQFWWLLM